MWTHFCFFGNVPEIPTQSNVVKGCYTSQLALETRIYMLVAAVISV